MAIRDFQVEMDDGSLVTVQADESATDDEILGLAAGGAAPQPTAEAEQQGQQPETTAAGVSGALTRGLGPMAAGAALGAAAGAPFLGVGAVPGAIAGAGAVGLTQLVGDPITEGVNKLFGTNFTKPTVALENLLTSLGVPEAKTQAERIIQQSASAVAPAKGVATAGKAVADFAKDEGVKRIGAALAASEGAQLAGAAGSGAGAQYAREEELGPLAEVGASLIGGVAGGSAAGLANAGKRALTGGTTTEAPIMSRASQAAQQSQLDVQAAERAGIPLHTSDVMPANTWAGKWLSQTGDKIPVTGTGSMRVGQQSAREDAVKKLLSEYNVGLTEEPANVVMQALSNAEKEKFLKYGDYKKSVINGNPAGVTVDNKNTLAAIDQKISEVEGLNYAANKPIIESLKDLKTAVQNQDLKNFDALRAQVGEAFNGQKFDTVRDLAKESFRGIYGPMKKDIEASIMQHQGKSAVNKWRVADATLSDAFKDLTSTTLKRSLNKGDVKPEVIRSMLFSKAPSEVALLYKSLNASGKSAAKTAILSEAATKATVDTAAGKVVSPDKFAAEAAKLGEQFKIFFRKDEAERINGLGRVLKLTQRASTANVLTPTGMQGLPIQAASAVGIGHMAGGATGAIAGIAVPATIGALARAYESPTVRNLLLHLAKTRPGSATEAEIAKRAVTAINESSNPNRREPKK